MSESELLIASLEVGNQLWVIWVWGYGTTFGLYSLAYLVGKKMSLGPLVFIVLTYVAFTFWVGREILRANSLIFGILDDLRALQSSGLQLSNVSINLINSWTQEFSNIWGLLGDVFPIMLALGGIAYLIYQFRVGQKARLKK